MEAKRRNHLLKVTKKCIALLLTAALLVGCAGSADTDMSQAGVIDTTEGTGTESAAGEEETGSTADARDEISTEQEEDAETWEQTVYEDQLLSMDDNYRTYYEVFLYSFYDSDGDGIGDINGLTEKLDYINDGDPATNSDLGCTGIWLMPIMPSPTYHKYDTTDYYGIDSAYGTMEDFEQLISACSERGIKVILDLALNHTSSEHPWFTEACSYLRELGDREVNPEECPYVDYYHFSKEKMSGYEPVEGSDIWYYEAQFWSGMPDLNLYNEALREEIEQIAAFWLSKGVGGFRLDAAKEYVTGADGENTEILAWFRDVVKNINPDAYLVAEVFSDLSVYENYYDSGIDSLFDFAFANKDGIISKVVNGRSAASVYSSKLEEVQNILASHNPDYIDAPFYTNHDMGRSAGYYAGEYSKAQTKLAGAMNLLMSGSAFVYYGEELGMKGSGKDENKRAPMYWEADVDAEGMCDGPADMDDFDMKFGSLAEQIEDETSVYAYYKTAIHLRNHYTAIRKGQTSNLTEYASDTIAAFKKNYEDETLYVFINASALDETLLLQKDLQELAIADALLTGSEKPSVKDGELLVPAYGVVVMR